MICNCRWFIQPATVISTNRNGSRTLGIWLAHYREPQALGGDERTRIQADPVSGPYGGRYGCNLMPHRWLAEAVAPRCLRQFALHPASQKNPTGIVELGFTVPDLQKFQR